MIKPVYSLTELSDILKMKRRKADNFLSNNGINPLPSKCKVSKYYSLASIKLGCLELYESLILCESLTAVLDMNLAPNYSEVLSVLREDNLLEDEDIAKTMRLDEEMENYYKGVLDSKAAIPFRVGLQFEEDKVKMAKIDLENKKVERLRNSEAGISIRKARR